MWEILLYTYVVFLDTFVHRYTTTYLTFRGDCLPPPKATFRGGYGFGIGIHKTTPNGTDVKIFDF